MAEIATDRSMPKGPNWGVRVLLAGAGVLATIFVFAMIVAWPGNDVRQMCETRKNHGMALSVESCIKLESISHGRFVLGELTMLAGPLQWMACDHSFKFEGEGAIRMCLLDMITNDTAGHPQTLEGVVHEANVWRNDAARCKDNLKLSRMPDFILDQDSPDTHLLSNCVSAYEVARNSTGHNKLMRVRFTKAQLAQCKDVSASYPAREQHFLIGNCLGHFDDQRWFRAQTF